VKPEVLEEVLRAVENGEVPKIEVQTLLTMIQAQKSL
jgi:hypothetical protein